MTFNFLKHSIHYYYDCQYADKKLRFRGDRRPCPRSDRYEVIQERFQSLTELRA